LSGRKLISITTLAAKKMLSSRNEGGKGIKLDETRELEFSDPHRETMSIKIPKSTISYRDETHQQWQMTES
jgi:hypothetical protein